MEVIKGISYDDRYDICKLDVYLPEKQTKATIVNFHGGGIEGGARDEIFCVEMAEGFVKRGYAYVSVGYRLYPNAKFPEFLQDAAKAVAYVKRNYNTFGEMVIGGQSAGAWISLMLCLDEKYLKAEGMSPLEIKGWLIDSAQTTSHYNVLKYEDGLDPLAQRINEYAPQFYVNENTAFSRILLMFYENDIPCRPEQNMLFYRNILAFNKDADIEYHFLPGQHCDGSHNKDEDGEYPFVKLSSEWLNKSEEVKK